MWSTGSKSFVVSMWKSRNRNTFVGVITLGTIILIFFLSYAVFADQLDVVEVESTVRSIHVLFRHGAKSPSNVYKNDPYQSGKYWPDGLNQLTIIGKRGMYRLGQNLRKRYDTILGNLYRSEDLTTRSSYADRCQMSLELLLAGLYPPLGSQIWNDRLHWQPIPINSVPRNLDNVIVTGMPCPKYDKLKTEVQKEILKNLTVDQQNLLTYLTIHSGQNISTILDVETLYFTLLSEKDNNLELPAWTNQVFPDKMLPIAELMEASLAWNNSLKTFASGKMLKEWRDHLLSFTENKKDSKKVYLYSGHDVTIVNLLRGLGFDWLKLPEYGASVVLELHASQPENYVKLLYYDSYWMDEPRLLIIPDCSAECPVSHFLSIIKPVVLDKEWSKECAL